MCLVRQKFSSLERAVKYYFHEKNQQDKMVEMSYRRRRQFVVDGNIIMNTRSNATNILLSLYCICESLALPVDFLFLILSSFLFKYRLNFLTKK